PSPTSTMHLSSPRRSPHKVSLRMAA
ncbi:hypothetical protein PEC301877_20100, partial [Pectobacterium carotovorum subsp. carotovorum]